MNEVISSVAEDNSMMVRGRYNELDLWILDDVQYLMESKSTQAEFFHIFNIFLEDNRQIIVSSDRPPNNLLAFDKTIRSRLGGGLAVEVGIPDVNTRMTILQKKQEKHGLNLDQKMLDYAAGILQSNVRELEGFLKKIFAYVTLSHQELTIDLIQRVVREILPEGQAAASSEQPASPPSQNPSPPVPTEIPQILEGAKIQHAANPGGAPAPQMQSPQYDVPPEAQVAPVSPAGKKPLEVVMPGQSSSGSSPPGEPPPTPPPQGPPAPKEAEGIDVPAEFIVSPDAPPGEPGKPTEDQPKEMEVPVVSGETVEPPAFDDELEEDELPNGFKEIKAVFFYPEGCEEALNSVFRKFQEVIKKHKLKFRLKKIKGHPYQFESQVNYSSFADVCKEAKVPVAVVIGPPPSNAVPETDFYDLLSVTLDVQGISLQLVNWTEINKDYRFLNLSLDIALVRTR